MRLLLCLALLSIAAPAAAATPAPHPSGAAAAMPHRADMSGMPGMWMTRGGKLIAGTDGSMAIVSRDGTSAMLMMPDGGMLVRDAAWNVVMRSPDGAWRTLPHGEKSPQGKLLTRKLEELTAAAAGTLKQGMPSK